MINIFKGFSFSPSLHIWLHVWNHTEYKSFCAYKWCSWEGDREWRGICKEVTENCQWNEYPWKKGYMSFIKNSALISNRLDLPFQSRQGSALFERWKKKLIKAEVRNCPAHLLPFPAPAALPGYWLLGWHPPDPNRWSLQGKGAKPLSSLPICLGGNGSLGWSWHSVQACLCNRGSHCLETHYNLSPAFADYEDTGWEWSCFIHEPASQEHPLSSWANNNMARRWVERQDSACLPAGPRLAQDLAPRRNLNGYQVGLWALQRFEWQCQQLTLRKPREIYCFKFKLYRSKFCKIALPLQKIWESRLYYLPEEITKEKRSLKWYTHTHTWIFPSSF